MRNENKTQSVTRRKFLQTATTGIAAFTIVPSYVLGGARHKAPSEKLNIAGVGVGGMGKGNLMAVCDPNADPSAQQTNVVALCDVDDRYAAATYSLYPKARTFRDFRKMLDQMGDQIDAVIVATPDHTHAVIALEAMKAETCLCTKTVDWTVYEARMLTEAARKYGVVTQMGNQGQEMKSV